VLAIILLTGRHHALCPSWRLWNLSSFRAIMRVGGPLFLLQLSDLAILNTANVLIANRLGPSEVPRYAVPFALLSTFSRVCYILAAPYWPAYAEAVWRGDWQWIRGTAARLLGATAGLMALGGAGTLLAGPALIRWWAGGSATPPAALLAWMTPYFLVMVASTTNGILLNGLGLVGVRAYLRVPVGLAHIIGGWWLLPQFGLLAIPLAGGIGFLADCVVLTPYAFRSLRQREEGCLVEARRANHTDE
jgi:O-antigen/teichoic acid export membrane protein